MRNFLFLSVVIILFPVTGVAQSIQGTIKDAQGNAIPYSTIYIRELSLGAAANDEGQFSVSVPPGRYVCVFQSLGYQPVIREVTVTTKTEVLEIVLAGMVYDLSAVVIAGKKEDPAYDIIRRVIAKAPYYAGLVKSYKAEVYIKGSLHINSISKVVKWLAKDDIKELKIREGDTYLQESVNRVDFMAPNVYKQTVVSFRNTFPETGGDMSANAIGFISGNIYTQNGFGAAFSPINRGAFNYYRYRYDGKVQYDTYAIHKITILPKGEGSQYVKGTVYIVDKLWCVSNLDIYKEEQLGVKLYLTQNYNEVKEGAWLPVSNQIKVDADLLGNSGTFNYHTAIRYNELFVKSESQKPALPLAVRQADKKAVAYHEKTLKQIDRQQQKLDKLQQENDLSTDESYRIARLRQKQQELRIKDSLRFNHEYHETYKLEADSNARIFDSTFWNKTRPIPLTAFEKESISSFDSTRKAEVKSDSAKFRPGAFALKVLLGGSFINDTTYNFRSRGLINPFSLSFDVVDGLKYYTSLTFSKVERDKREYGFQPMLGYAFGSKRVIWELLAYRRYNPLKRETGLRMGQQTFDYNPDGIHPLESSIEALIFRENPARFYHASYLDLHLKSEIVHSLSGSVNIYAADNSVIQNVTGYSFFYKDSKEYEPNVPDNFNYRMKDHQDLSLEFGLTYQPMPFYYVKNGIKVPYQRFNDRPEFSLLYTKGIPLGMFDTDYDLLKLIIQQQKRLGIYNRLNYRFEAGYYINNKSMWFPQYQHFAKRPLIAGVKEFFPYFLLIDSYRFSTNDKYAVCHLQYKSPFIILKRLPVLRNRLWNENLFFSYLYTPETMNYMEAGYGIGGLIFNLGVFTGFRGLIYQQTGIRMAFTIFGSKEISL
ncbi:MAG TPA: DUF5686 and carboxypeptidase regulatory-like domain-containing protein [Lentimicrobium sp.]|nr:DUF5686 and carboxypeptidase regulatory-like domain-containing protein [Lentimicrobium sp.]